MKKIGLIVKETSENKIRDTLKLSNGIFIVRYSGVASPDLSGLRMNLKGSNATLFVAKNSVARRALKAQGLEPLIKTIEGPCGLVFVKDEPVGVSKVLCKFSKDHEQLKLEGGFLEDKLIERKDIEEMAKLPSKEVLRAMVVGTLNSPIQGLVTVLSQTIKKFVYCLEQIKNKKPN